MSAATYSRPSSYGTRPPRLERPSTRAARYNYYNPTSVAEELDYDYGYDAPSISVVPGSGRKSAGDEGISAAVLTLAKVCAVACILLALVAMGRVAITSAAASCALETRSLQSSIEEARAEGSDLEISQSVLSNPSRIKTQAQGLGMAAPTAAFSDQIILPPDIVATDEEGRLSLSETTARVAQG